MITKSDYYQHPFIEIFMFASQGKLKRNFQKHTSLSSTMTLLKNVQKNSRINLVSLLLFLNYRNFKVKINSFVFSSLINQKLTKLKNIPCVS